MISNVVPGKLVAGHRKIRGFFPFGFAQGQNDNLGTAPQLEASCKRKQGDIARLLDGERETALVAGADAGKAARHNLAPLGDETLKQADVAVADGVDLLDAEFAYLLAAEVFASAFPSATARSAARSTRTRSATTVAAPAATA